MKLFVPCQLGDLNMKSNALTTRLPCRPLFKVATLCLVDRFAQSWHSLNQLHLECFAYSLQVICTYAEHLLAAFPSLCSPTHPKRSQLGSGRVIVEAKSSYAALRHSPYWSYNTYTAWMYVGSLSCWKTNDSPTKCKPDGMVYRCRILW